jgi:Ca2+/H+ antiporter, TMEM165/GDT1 family
VIDNALVAFGTVVLAELPDKSMVVSLMLTTRYRRPLAVWCGIAVAFAMHVILAVAIGSVIGRLPHRPIAAIVGALFGVGAVLVWRESNDNQDHDAAELGRPAQSFIEVSIVSGSVLLVAEFGDLTQLATAGLASRTGDALGVAVGAWLGLATVAALAVAAGRWLQGHVPMVLVRRSAAAVFAGFGIWSVIVAIRG